MTEPRPIGTVWTQRLRACSGCGGDHEALCQMTDGTHLCVSCQRAPADMTEHICSETMCSCPSCGFEDTRDAFEGWEGNDGLWVVRCRECEAEHPDQSNWDDRDCVACEDEGRYA